MRILMIGLTGILLLAGCQPAPQKPAAATSESAPATSSVAPAAGAWVLGAEGVGPLKVGMSLAEVEAALGTKIPLNAEASGDENGCATAEVPGHEGLSMMFNGKHLTSLLVFEPGTSKTAKGIGIGSTEDEVRAAYTGLEITGRAYYEAKDPNRELTTWTVKGKSGIVFLTDENRKVDQIRAGDETITWMEGCA